MMPCLLASCPETGMDVTLIAELSLLTNAEEILGQGLNVH